MNALAIVAAAGAVTLALVLAPYVAPRTALYHDWRYAAALVVAALPLVSAAWNARRRSATRVERFAGLAAVGGLVVAGAGLWSGLAGADTETIVGAPGSSTRVPALGDRVRFSPADDAALREGSAAVTIDRGAASLSIARGGSRIDGAHVYYLVPRVAARIDARDAKGEHLTVTQPSNATFLSDVLLFRSEQKIKDDVLPVDTFATPARGRVLHALYFTPKQLAAFRHGVAPGIPALVLTASDEQSRPLGIALAASGETIAIGGLRIRAVLGTYPALAVASAPEPWAVILGTLLFLGGLGAGLPALRAPAPAPQLTEA